MQEKKLLHGARSAIVPSLRAVNQGLAVKREVQLVLLSSVHKLTNIMRKVKVKPTSIPSLGSRAQR